MNFLFRILTFIITLLCTMLVIFHTDYIIGFVKHMTIIVESMGDQIALEKKIERIRLPRVAPSLENFLSTHVAPMILAIVVIVFVLYIAWNRRR